MISPPASSEYPAYYDGYVQRVYNMDVMQMLHDQIQEIENLTLNLDEDTATSSYAAGKWTVKEVLGHITDAERVFAYRLLRFIRKDETPLPGYDHNAYVETGAFNSQTLRELVSQFRSVRLANLSLYKTVTEEVARQGGMMVGNTVTVRGLLYIIAGHVAHHAAILKERYGL